MADDNEGALEPTLDMSDIGGGGDDGDEDSGGGGFDAKKILLFVVIPLLLLGGAGAGLYFSGMLGGGDAAKQETASNVEGGQTDEYADSHGGEGGEGSGSAYFLKIPDMVVNLSTDSGQPRYLRLVLQLELRSAFDQAAIEAVMPRVVDQFQTYLRELRERDLRGSQGVYRLQMELLSRVNAAAFPIEVKDVLFQEILIQ